MRRGVRWLPFAIALSFAAYPGVLRADFTAADCNDGLGACLQPNNQKQKTSPAQDACKNGAESGDPVDSGSGTDLFNITDFAIPGRGLGVEIRRFYRNGGQFNGPFGYNWSFAYYLRARKLTSGNYLVIDATGHELVFHAEGTNGLGENSYCGCDVFSHLIEHANGNLTVLRRNGGRIEFNRNGAVVAIVDRFRNTIRFEYLQDGAGNDLKPPIFGKSKYFLATGGGTVAREFQLIRIIDTYGRELDLSYFGAADGAKMGRLKQVLDYLGRKVSYDYDDDGNLIAVTAPATNDFPSGTTTHYTYSAHDPNEDLNHNLLTVTDASGRLVLTNVYDSNDRILAQTSGGGTTTWSYNIPARITTTTDPNGNVSETTFSTQGTPFRARQFTRGVHTGEPAFYQTLQSFDSHDDLVQVTYPRGNSVSFSRSAQGRILTTRRSPIGVQPGTAADIVTQATYDPIYEQTRTVTTPRGQTISAVFDYQEGNDLQGLALRLGISPDEVSNRLVAAGIPMNLGDVNGDGLTSQINGRAIQVSYPGMLVDGVLQPVTRVMTYNDAGQRLSETDPEGRRTTYDYYPGDDPDGDGVIVPGATDTAHDGYVKSVHLAAGTPDETTETIVYDPAGNPTSLTDARGSTTHFEFDAQNRLVRTTSPAPFLDQVVVHYDATGRLLTLDVENKDQAGNPVASNPWFTTNWSYDALGRLSTVTREIDETHTAATTFDYDLAGHVTQITKPEGNRETYEYDERGLLYRATLGAGASSASAFGFDYDANGNRSIVRDPLNHATTYAWDDFDRLSVVTNGLGVQTSLTYDDESNLVSTQAKDASAILLSETDYAFDNFDRVSSVTRAILDGSGAVTGNLVSSFVYDRTGNVIRETGGGGRQLTYDYDSLGRFLDARDSIGNRVTNAYDSGGNVIQQTFVDIDTQSGSPTTTTGPLAVYDEMNRLRSSIDVTGSQSTFGYDSRSNLASMHDPDGRTVAYVWDGLNRVRSTTQSSVSGGLSVAENALYDLNGRPTEFVDGLGNRTHFVYDEQDRVAGTTLGYQTGVDASYAYTYDADGNVKSVSFPSGRTTTYGYDILDRLITRAAGTLSETFGYDSRNRIASASARDGGTVTSSVTIAYDSLDQITSETQDGLPVLTAYDGDGYRTHLTYPGGLALTEEHAPNGELTGVRDGAGRSLLANDFRGLGRVTRESYGNLSKTLTTFDSIGRLDSRTHLTSGNATMKSAGYAYDRSGNQLLARRSENAGGGDVFHYDVLSRLTQEWHGASAVDLQNIIDAVSAGAPAPNPQVYSSSTSYTLDSAGNRTASVDAGGTHVYTPNPLNEYGVAAGAPQSYDPDGNLISDATFLYHYDALGRMSGVDRLSDGTPLATYRYDALGRRIGKQTATTNVRYVYDGARLIQERDSSGSVLAEYAYGRGLDDVFLMKRAGHEFYYHKDSLGSVSAVSGDGGTLAESYTYDAFGRVSAYDATGHAIAATGIGNPWMYAGRQYDEETGTYYNRFRPYAPAAGRFLARDPLGSTDGLNLYQYGGGNPTNWTDPWGLERIADLDNLRALSDLSKYDPGFRHRFLDAIQDGSSIEPLIAAQIPRAEKLRHEAEAEIAKIMDQIKQANPPHKSIDDFLPPLRDPRKEQRPTVGPVGSLHGPIKPPRRSDQQEPFDKLMDEIKDKMVDKLIKEPIRDTVIHAIPVVADDAVDVLLHAANPPGVPKALKSEGLINFLRRVKFKVIPAWDAARIIASIEKANAVMDVCSVILEMQGDGKPHFQVVRDQISDLLSEIQEFSSADRNLILGTYDSEELESYIFEGTNSREEWLRRLRHLPPQNPFAK